MSNSTGCKKCNGVSSYKSNTLEQITFHCHECNGIGKIYQSNTEKAAIATLEHLGYEYNGGEQWKPPVNAKGWEGIEDARKLLEEEPVPKWTKSHIVLCETIKHEIIKEYLAAQVKLMETDHE